MHLFAVRELSLVRNRKYLPEYAFELLRLADSDLASGHALVAAKVRFENACFHYQQTVEKSLKAVLVHKGVAFPSTQDLNVLLALLPEMDEQCPHTHEIPELNIYSAQRRYEEGPTPATQEDTDDAALMASAALKWAKGICK
jgi:HEPN domain-containing protein